MKPLWAGLTGWVAVAALLWAAAAEGQLYRWTAPDGVVHFTDTPPAGPGLSIEAVPGTGEQTREAGLAPPPPSPKGEDADLTLAESAPVAGVPPEVVAAVEKLARRLHSGDRAAQAVVMRQQLDAWRAMEGYSAPDLPSAMLASFFSIARDENPYDYTAQKYSVDVQVAAYRQAGGRPAEMSPLPPPGADSGGSTQTFENTTIVYPRHSGYYRTHPAPAAPKPYILYHPGPNASRYGNTPDPVILMPPGWKPLTEEPPSERRDTPAPRPGRSGSGRIGSAP